jgi:hypothetical protein
VKFARRHRHAGKDFIASWNPSNSWRDTDATASHNAVVGRLP